ncbi:MAG TPA: zf-HC2 domain-containing protein [Polyangiales bacterium]|jgi:hypothetical protein|nr:zf-HC2 domain-containing protein [Polyangiales bacterium]
MLRCKNVDRELSEALDQRLSWPKRLGVRLHLWLCARCRATERSLSFTHSMLRKLASTPPPPADES